MKKIFSLLALCLPLTTFAAASQPAASEAEQSNVQVLVKIDEQPVTNLHFAIFNAQTGQKSGGQQQQITLLNELVNTFMVANSKDGQTIGESAEIKAAVEVARARLIAQALIGNLLKNAPVDNAKVEKMYEERYAGKSGVEYKARHILLKTEDEAKAVIKELDGGADFAELAKSKSTGPSKTNGGDLGWFEPERMVAAFSEATVKLDNGSYSKEPVKTQFGWHVIKREDSREVPSPTLESVRAELEKELRSEHMTAYITAIRDKTKIEIQAPAVAPAPAE